LDEVIHLDAISFRMTDTAGLRKSNDEVELQGIERTIQACQHADIVVIVIDPTQGCFAEQCAQGVQLKGRRLIRVFNKTDLYDVNCIVGERDEASFPICALNGDGLDDLRTGIVKLANSIRNGSDMDSYFLVNQRHLESLRRCNDYLHQAQISISQGYESDAVASDIRLGVQCLGDVIGLNYGDEVIDRVFSRFCIGK
jgi:tRNA modification GTPase